MKRLQGFTSGHIEEGAPGWDLTPALGLLALPRVHREDLCVHGAWLLQPPQAGCVDQHLCEPLNHSEEHPRTPSSQLPRGRPPSADPQLTTRGYPSRCQPTSLGLTPSPWPFSTLSHGHPPWRGPVPAHRTPRERPGQLTQWSLVGRGLAVGTCAGFALGQVVALLPLGICGHLLGASVLAGELALGAHLATSCRLEPTCSAGQVHWAVARAQTEALAHFPGPPSVIRKQHAWGQIQPCRSPKPPPAAGWKRPTLALHGERWGDLK